MRIQSLPPLTGDNPEILILGSMPGEESLNRQQYFAFRHNRFWKVMFEFFGKEFSTEYETRKNLIKQNRLALWDVIQSCEREHSSLDSKIRKEQPVELKSFLKEYPTIKLIVLNGKKAETVYKKHFNDINFPVVCLPSTSPANASHNFEKLFEAWRQVLKKL